MANALHDDNHNKTLIVESDTVSGETTRLNANTSGALNVSMGESTNNIGNVKILDEDGDVVGVQTPFSVDGDQVYVKDINTSTSNMNNFSGSVADLFDSLTSVVTDVTSNDPKEIEIHFNRTIPVLVMGLGAATGDFSNVKIIGLASGGAEATVYDNSTDNTKRTTQTISIVGAGLNGIKVQFHTTDTVSLSNVTVGKATSTLSRIQGKRDDGDYQEIGSTDEGLFKVLSHSFDLAVAEGQVLGHTIFEKYGRNSDIDTGSDPEDIWNGSGDYTGFPTGAAETMEILSSNAADTSAGTGARTVTIYNLLDDTGAEMPDITVTLNGTTPVSLGAQTYYRGGTRMKVITAGSGGGNAGTLTLRHTTTTANIFAVMPIGKNQTAIAAYTVPLGQTLYIKRINFQMARSSGAAGSASVTLRARPHGEVFHANPSPEITNSSSYSFVTSGYYIFQARTDIKARCESVSDNNTIITAEFSGYLIDD